MDEKLWAYEKQKGEAGEKKEMNKMGQRCSKKQTPTPLPLIYPNGNFYGIVRGRREDQELKREKQDRGEKIDASFSSSPLKLP